jgi:O-antigen/teichoic acid export membrane protein
MKIGWLRSDVSTIVAVGFITQALTVLSGPLVARMLGPGGRGDLVMVTVISVLSAHLASTSLTNAIASVVARRQASARDVLGRHAYRWGVMFTVPGIVSACATLVLLRDAPHLELLMFETFLVTLLACWLNMLRAMVQGEHSVSRVNTTRIAFSSVYVVSVVLLFVVDGVGSAAFVLPCQLLAQLVAVVIGIRSLRPRDLGYEGPDAAAEIYAFTRHAYVSSLGTTDLLGLDQLLVGLLLGSAPLGLYGVAVSTTTLAGIVVTGLSSTLLPRMSARTPEAAAEVMRRWFLAGLGVSVVIVVGIEVIIGPALRILFGAEFVPATTAARILAVASALSGMRFLIAAAAQAQGSARRASMVDLVSGAVLVTAVTVGAQGWGIEGAALGVVAAQVVNCGALLSLISWTGKAVGPQPDQRTSTISTL